MLNKIIIFILFCFHISWGYSYAHQVYYTQVIPNLTKKSNKAEELKCEKSLYDLIRSDNSKFKLSLLKGLENQGDRSVQFTICTDSSECVNETIRNSKTISEVGNGNEVM